MNNYAVGVYNKVTGEIIRDYKVLLPFDESQQILKQVGVEDRDGNPVVDGDILEFRPAVFTWPVDGLSNFYLYIKYIEREYSYRLSTKGEDSYSLYLCRMGKIVGNIVKDKELASLIMEERV